MEERVDWVRVHCRVSGLVGLPVGDVLGASCGKGREGEGMEDGRGERGGRRGGGEGGEEGEECIAAEVLLMPSGWGVGLGANCRKNRDREGRGFREEGRVGIGRDEG